MRYSRFGFFPVSVPVDVTCHLSLCCPPPPRKLCDTDLQPAGPTGVKQKSGMSPNVVHSTAKVVLEHKCSAEV
jgi:hypothetical protein